MGQDEKTERKEERVVEVREEEKIVTKNWSMVRPTCKVDLSTDI